MNKQIIVSICCITYNHEKYIREAIESFLMQKTTFPIEIIIHDDASIDNTRNIIKEYEIKYPKIIKPIYQQKNQYSQGIEINLTYQFPRALGKYIAICEGDDYWTDPYKLQKQVDFLEANPKYGLVHSDLNHWYDKSKTLVKNYNAVQQKLIPEGDIYYELLDPKKYIIKTPTVVFRKDLHDEHVDYRVIREKGWLLNDLFTWLSIARFSWIKYIPEAMATYRVLSESASHTNDYQLKLKIHQSVYEIRAYFANKYPCPEKILNKIKISHIETILFDAFRTADKKLSLEILKYARDNKIFLNIKSSLLYFGTQNKKLNKILNQLW